MKNLFVEPLFPTLLAGHFLRRINRFVVECMVNGHITRAYLPNPGRLWELLLPRAPLYLIPSPRSDGKYPYTVVAVKKGERIVVLHTQMTNTVARHLIEYGRIPGLEGATVERSEVKYGRHRFDFLLRNGETDTPLEVKSCTLFGKRLAMFPDAITTRGKEHILQLAELSGTILFIVSTNHVSHFAPDYHTDLAFAKALITHRARILIRAVGVSWRENLTLETEVRDLSIPWETLTEEALDRGCYLLVLHIPHAQKVHIGALNRVPIREGYHIYVGSAQKNLEQRIAHHRRISTHPFWHIDYVRPLAAALVPIAIRTSHNIEHDLAHDLHGIASVSVPRFGTSDCTCPTHLFFMDQHPLHDRAFLELLSYYRMDRLPLA